MEGRIWSGTGKAAVKAELKKADVTYEELAARLTQHGDA